MAETQIKIQEPPAIGEKIALDLDGHDGYAQISVDSGYIVFRIRQNVAEIVAIAHNMTEALKFTEKDMRENT